MSLKKSLKIIGSVFSLVIPLGFIVGFSTAWNSPPSITIAGSSAVQPLMTTLGDNYSEADIVVQAGGSSEGLKVAATLTKDLGNASKNPYESVQKATIDKNGFNLDTWKKNNMKTVTIAWDGLGIVYKPSNPNSELIIDSNTIYDIYAMFSGLYRVKMSDLIPGEKNIDFIPYARTGGANTSGTATSFLNESNLTSQTGWDNALSSKGYIKDEIITALKTGNYNKNGNSNVISTNESNVESWSRIKNDNITGSIIYLSLGFIEKNKSAIESAGFKIAKLKTEQSNQLVEPTIANVSNGTYVWSAPLNSIISLTHATQEVKEFLWWIVWDNRAQQIIEQIGYAPLANSQKLSMINTSSNSQLTWEQIDINTFYNLENSDDKLHQINNQPWYGALKK